MKPDDLADDQVASQDEYEISLKEGVEDESLLDETSVKKFSITSYGADYTVDSLVKRMKAGAFRVPEFQRRFIWSQRHASKFVESLLMGLPVPGIFLYKESGTNKHLVIDGQQRLRTLEAFYRGLFGDKPSEKIFRLVNIRDPWNGKNYDELDPSDQLKIDDSIVHATIFTQDEPADVLDSIYFVFERINSGGIRLSPQEIRNCISDGPFVKLVKKLNEDTYWRKVFGGPPNKRAKDEEMIIRYFAMLDRRDIYARPMAKFLNDYSDVMNKAEPATLATMGQEFRDTVRLVDDSLNGRAFRPVRSLNAAVLDSCLVGISSRLRTAPSPTPSAISTAYDNLIESSEYRKSWVRATADEENVKNRMEMSIAAFANI